MTITLSLIRKTVQELQNPKIAEDNMRFFKMGKGQYGAGDHFLGIRMPVLRELVKRFQGVSVLTAGRLLRSKFHEERLLALLMLVRLFAKGTEAVRAEVYRLYLDNTQFVNNWDLVDCSAEYIVGVYLYERDRRPLYALARSSSLWERRIAVLATFHFIRKNDFGDTLKIGKMLLSDTEDLIHKAVGWMLRETGNRNLELEEGFLKLHLSKMPRTMLRYAIEKFPEGKRKAYLKR